jgi:hypothetical protein
MPLDCARYLRLLSAFEGVLCICLPLSFMSEAGIFSIAMRAIYIYLHYGICFLNLEELAYLT